MGVVDRLGPICIGWAVWPSTIVYSYFYSAPSIFAVFRNLVREIRFKKSGSANLDFFSGSRKVIDQKNRWVYAINPSFSGLRKVILQTRIFFLVREKKLTRKKIRVCRTTFLEPLFYTLLEKWLQIKWSTGLHTRFNG